METQKTQLISIIVPIYNPREYLEYCVNSILNQTYKKLEIILVDDGSTDGSSVLCDAFAEKDERVKVIHKENGGLMSARQAGLKVATGEYVTFVDGDDWIKLNMYEKFADKIEMYHPDILLCEFLYTYPDHENKSEQNLSSDYFNKTQLEQDIYPQMLFKDTFYRFGVYPCCWSKVFKRDILIDNLLTVDTDVKIGEDAAFTYPCIFDSSSLVYISDYLYHYRQNPKSMSNVYDINLEKSILIPYFTLKEKFKTYNYGLNLQLNYYLLYLINLVIRNEANKNNTKSKQQIKQTLKIFTSDDSIINAVKTVDINKLPFHTRVIYYALVCRNTELLFIYIKLFRRFL